LRGAASPTISARTILSNGSTNCATGVNCRYWLQGPIVTAATIEDLAGCSFDVNTENGSGNPLHPISEAWFYPQGNKVEVGFTLEDSWSSSTVTNSARNPTFSLTLSTGHTSPTVHLSQSSFTEWHLLVGGALSGWIRIPRRSRSTGIRSICSQLLLIQSMT